MITTLLLLLTVRGHVATSAPQFNREVKNWKVATKALRLGPSHLSMLRKNGFFVSPGNGVGLEDVYAKNDYQNLASFITVDSVLQLYHLFFDSTLRTVEEQHLYPDVKRLVARSLSQSEARLRAVAGTPLKSAAMKNVAYFGVADRLLGGKSALPDSIEKFVDAELVSIRAHSGFGPMTIFPYDHDYSQFAVRGHYTRSPALAEYFEVMMWFGLVPFAMETSRAGVVRPNLEQVRQIALMADDLQISGGQAAWNRIYSFSAVFAGTSNDLTPTAWRALTTPILGSPMVVSRLDNVNTLRKIIKVVKSKFHPAISARREKGVRPLSVQFRLMGQRSIPDSIALQKLSGPNRPWVSSLDIGSVLGSSRALAFLKAKPKFYIPFGWPSYASTRRALIDEWKARPTGYWSKDLYNGYLDLLRKTIDGSPERAPAVLHTKAYNDRLLSTALAGWAELRHDTLLYGAQSVAEMGDGDEPVPFVKGYVEPNLNLYRRLLDLLSQMQNRLTVSGYFAPSGVAGRHDDIAAQFKNFRELLNFFLHVSKQELAGQRLQKADHLRIRHIEGELAALSFNIQVLGTDYQILSQDDSDMALVADVHTAGDQALEVGVGHADDLIIIIPIEGKRYLARGSVFSFYEFRTPISDRMTDHAWKKLVQEGKTPPRPSWIKGYFVPTMTARE